MALISCYKIISLFSFLVKAYIAFLVLKIYIGKRLIFFLKYYCLSAAIYLDRLCMKKKYYKKGEEIIKEGMLSDCAYIIDAGKVEVSKICNNGEKQIFDVLNENDIFGEMGLIDGFPRSATVIALEDCTISIMTQEAFNSLAQYNPQALMPILKVLAKRLRATLTLVEELQAAKPTPTHPSDNI